MNSWLYFQPTQPELGLGWVGTQADVRGAFPPERYLDVCGAVKIPMKLVHLLN